MELSDKRAAGKNNPLKRHEALKPLSREHHHGLLLCWKIRQGFKFHIEPERMKKYVDWFKVHYLDPHFETEEKFVFPVMGNDHDKVKKALADHRRLRWLFDEQEEVEKALHRIEEELDLHIRFEERDLFNEIQQKASPEEFAAMEEKHHSTTFSDDQWPDHFWTRNK